MKRGRVSWLATVIVTVIAVGVITYLGVSSSTPCTECLNHAVSMTASPRWCHPTPYMSLALSAETVGR